ncbi:MAG: hypothetical protein N3E40_00125 [Dehalococcoidia bacterium]|nr:hypothetical protein [Dehalococcoidia bacterium]
MQTAKATFVKIKHLDANTVALAVVGDGPVKVDRDCLINELAFPSRFDFGCWVRLPATVAEQDDTQSKG